MMTSQWTKWALISDSWGAIVYVHGHKFLRCLHHPCGIQYQSIFALVSVALSSYLTRRWGEQGVRDLKTRRPDSYFRYWESRRSYLQKYFQLCWRWETIAMLKMRAAGPQIFRDLFSCPFAPVFVVSLYESVKFIKNLLLSMLLSNL